MILSPAFSTTWPSGLAVLAYLAASAWPQPDSASASRSERPIWTALTLAWVAHAAAIVLDVLALDGPTPGARFGFAPALSVTAWLMLSVYAIESRRLGLPSVRRGLGLLACAMVALAWVFPGRSYAATAGSPWAPLHWLMGFASYGLFGIALLHAALLKHAERQLRAKPIGSPDTGFGGLPKPSKAQALGMPLLQLESLTFRFVAVGFAMLTLTLVLGTLTGQAWRWDHKTVFSVLSWVVFAILLLGRARFGWRGRQAARWLIAGSLLLLLSYVGSRFVMEVVLHRATTS